MTSPLPDPSSDWSYHPNCWCGGEHGLLAIEAKMCHCLWLQSQVPGLLSFIKVYFSFFLNSKLDEVVIGRPLVSGLTINQMSQLSSISFSRALIEHPEPTYQYASASHIQRSLVLESSFNFRSMIFQFRQRSKVPSCSWFCPSLVMLAQRQTLKSQKQSPTHCPLNNVPTGQRLASMGNSASVFKEAVDQRQSYSGPGQPVLEFDHIGPFSDETLLGSSVTPLVI